MINTHIVPKHRRVPRRRNTYSKELSRRHNYAEARNVRYHYDKDTVYILGNWRAACTGIDGGISNVTTIFNRTVATDFSHTNLLAYVHGILAEKGCQTDAFGLLTAVAMKNLCILQYDYITVFVTTGVTDTQILTRPGRTPSPSS